MRDESTEDTTKYERHKKNSREKLIVTDKVIVRTKTQKVSPAWAAYHTGQFHRRYLRQAAEE
jgi:hypothetical protein